MKILQLTCHFSPNLGGVETHLDDLVSALVNRKNKVFVLTYKPLTTKVSASIYETRRDGAVTILRIPWIKGLFFRLVGSPLLEFLYLLPGIFLVTPFVLFIFNPKVIHAHGLVAGFVGLFWGRLFRKRVVISTHSIYHFPKQGIYRNFVKYLFKNADVTLCLSQQSRGEIIKLGIPEVQVKVFTYWIDLDVFSEVFDAKKSLGLREQFVVLFVGRLIPEKGVIELLESSQQWNKKISLVIAGAGPLESKVKKRIRDKQVVYAGRVLQSDLPLYYSAADVLVVPSVHEEGFGRVIIESLACATPVIASKRGGIQEALNYRIGDLIEITPRNIKKTVEYYYKNKKELDIKSKRARKYAEENFSEKNINVILSSYE